MGVSVDTFDQESGIHPRNKQLPSQRLAWAGLNIAYDQDTFPTNGPYPEAVIFAPTKLGIQADVLYDETFIWDDIETNGLYYCCAEEYLQCFDSQNVWFKVIDYRPNKTENTFQCMT